MTASPYDQGPEPPLAHGGNLAEARRLFPQAPEPWIDLSTGINPIAYPFAPVPASAWAALPSPQSCARLESAAAHCYGVDAARSVVAMPGTQAAIQWLPRLFRPGTAAVLEPTYAEHGRVWRTAGHAVVTATALSDLDQADIAVVVNPNNPDGRRLDNAMLLSLADRKAARGGLLVVDEAFADMEPALSLAGAAGRPGLAVLRSFGKFFGLAGLRLGFVLAAHELTERLRAAMGPWAVSGEAIEIGSAALIDRAWQEATRRRLHADAAALDRLLARAELAVVGGTDLFRLVRTAKAAAAFDALGAAGIWVRRFSEQPQLLRFGLPPSASAQSRLAAALTTERSHGIGAPAP